MTKKTIILISFLAGSFYFYSCEGKNAEEHSEDVKKELDKVEVSYIISIDDIVINPAYTNGQRLMLTSVALELRKEKDYHDAKNKEIAVRDAIISILSSKSVQKLTEVGYKDSLKIEIRQNLKNSLPNSEIDYVYFTKYIVQ